MAIADINAIIKTYLDTCATLTGLVSTRIYQGRLPENATLPAIGFLCRGGVNNTYSPSRLEQSVQFDCWADDLMEARNVYRALYSNLQGIQNVSVSCPDKVIGTDSNGYNCKLSHTSNNRNKPITGTLTATYWSVSTTTNTAAVWESGILYSPTYLISAGEEVAGQDLVDMDIPRYFRVLTFFNIMIRAE